MLQAVAPKRAQAYPRGTDFAPFDQTPRQTWSLRSGEENAENCFDGSFLRRIKGAG
jgi:hypothetical protein